MRDEMLPGRDKAVYWIEHVLRHGGTQHMELASKKLYFYQNHLFDVYAFLVIVGIALLALASYSVRFCVRLCVTKPAKSKTQ